MKNFKGFSLVELITVIAIIGIMTAVAIVSLTPAKTSVKLDAAGRELVAAIKQAQSYALQGKVVRDDANNVVPCGFGIYIKNNTDYEIFYMDNANCASYNSNVPLDLSGSKTLEAYKLKDNIVFNNPNNERIIYFAVPHGTLFGNNGNPFTGLTISLIAPGGTTKNVVIGSGGAVTEQ